MGNNICAKCHHWNGGVVLCEHYAEEAERREVERKFNYWRDKAKEQKQRIAELEEAAQQVLRHMLNSEPNPAVQAAIAKLDEVLK